MFFKMFFPYSALPKARGSLLVARCVRDWSGILCELFRTTVNGQRTTVNGFFFERGENRSEQRYSGKPGA